MSFPYVVWTPPYDHFSGGNKALHALAYEIQKKGFDVYINTTAQGPDPQKHIKVTFFNNEPAILSKCIAIYPEIVYGNPLNAPVVVRWLLNKPGKLSGPTNYPDSDLTYPFAQAYNVFRQPAEDIICLTTVDLDIFKDLNLPRKDICFYVGKGKTVPRIKETEGKLEITKTWPASYSELANIFQTSELFISYDDVTILTEMSRLCGCPTVIISNDLNRSEVGHEFGWNGLGWGIEEASKAKATLNPKEIYDKFVENYEIFLQRLDLMLEKTQNVAKMRVK